VPLDVKLVLFGDRDTWLLLQEYDPEFAELFRVTADFENEMPRTTDSQALYAKFIASLCQDKKLLPCDRKAVARVIEYSARLAEHQDRLSLHAVDIANLLRESDFHARGLWRRVVFRMIISTKPWKARITAVGASGMSSCVASAMAPRLFPCGRGRGTDQCPVSVIDRGYEFGLPNRVSATCQYGDGDVIHIERDVKLSGVDPFQGVMILSAWLSSRFAREQPMPLTATLTFEQSYAEIDGDSASLGELCAIISSLSELPIRQDRAVTGSVNQFGEVQPVGGVNEKRWKGFMMLALLVVTARKKRSSCLPRTSRI